MEAPSDAHPDDALTSLKQEVANALDVVRRELERRLETGSRVGRIAARLSRAGGKQLRAALTLAVAQGHALPPEVAVAVAAAVEIVHLGSLLHDDVLDGSARRRGLPAAHVEYGVSSAILAGDLCIARAFETLGQAGLAAPAAMLGGVIAAMADAELLDLRLAEAAQVSRADYLQVVDGKTGRLFRYGATVGGLIPEDRSPALSDYGRHLGRAFQFADDLLDHPGVAGAAETTAPPILDRVSLPVVLAAEREPELWDQLARARSDPGERHERWQDLWSTVHRAGGAAAARALALEAAEAARTALQHLPPARWRSLLEGIATFAADRTG